MKKIKTTLFIILNLLLILMLSSCFKDNDTLNNYDYSETQTEEFRYHVTQDTITFDLSNINGNITVTGLSNTDSIVVFANKIVESYSPEDAKNKIDLIEISATDDPEVYTIETDQPNSGNGRNFIVNYFVTVPKDVRIILKNVNGIVQVDSTGSELFIENVNGSIVLDEINGNAQADLTNGSITGRITNNVAEISMNIVNGNILLHIPQNTNAEFTASVVLGIISINGIDIVDRDTNENVLQGTIGSGNSHIALSTVSGNINVTGF